MGGDEQALGGPERVELRVGVDEVTVTRDDLRALRQALVERLRESELDGREDLIVRTEAAPAWIDVDGVPRIGGWVMQARGAELVLAYRLPASATAATGFVAKLRRDADAWTIDDILPEKIRVRR
jgi:hypothetical protein